MSDDRCTVRVRGVRKAFARRVTPWSLYGALRARLRNGRAPADDAYPRSDFVIALDRIDFALRPGEWLGVIGDNGAGKSTLLRLVAGLYPPSAGSVDVAGEMALVAGLNVGMLDELSIEDNLLLYGAIYGTYRSYMRERVPEILEWAGLAEFTGAKLKVLSSGMRARLAFSAVRHFEKSVYLLDEVLAAGDRHFKEKCERTFEEMKATDKTLLVATHDMAFVQRFCNRALWLDHGLQMACDDARAVVESYTGQRN